jgi:hypothetical protein
MCWWGLPIFEHRPMESRRQIDVPKMPLKEARGRKGIEYLIKVTIISKYYYYQANI